MSASSPIDPEELLSAEFDSSDSDPASAVEMDADHATSLLAKWRQVGDSLRALPMRKETNLHLSVLQQIRGESRQPLEAASAQTSQFSYSDRASQGARWAALVSSLAAVLLVCVSWIVAPDRSGLVQSGLIQPATVAQSSLMRLEEDVASLPGNWEVLVVTVAANRQGGIPESVRKTVGDRGLRLHSLADSAVVDESHPGVLMATGDVSSELRGVLEADPDDFQIEMNPDQIGDLSRSELLNKFAESMRVPTKSDEYFGEMYAILPDDDALVVKSLPSKASVEEIVMADAANSADPETLAHRNSPENAVGQATAQNVAHVAKSRLSKSSGKPVLVVFVKRKPAPPNHRSSNQPHSIRAGQV